MKTINLLLLGLFALTSAWESSSTCSFGLYDVGSLDDGQLRLGYGTGASNVTFTLKNGWLTSSLGFICYISAQTQLQCNTPSQTNADSSFSIYDGQLAYNESISWWQCDAGTGGSNLYTTQYYSHCTPATLTVVYNSSCTTTSTSSQCLSLNNVGSLCDGQLRLGYGSGANNVTFNLTNGYLTSSLNFICYISAQTQLQCNTPPQTMADSSFSVIDGQLAYNGSTSWWQCDAGTGGSNLYTTQYYSHCTAATLTVSTLQTCSTIIPNSCLSASTSSVAATTSSAITEVDTTSEDLTTTSESSSCFSLSNIGTLCDGQLRYNYGTGSINVTFTLDNGYLTSSLGFLCYISAQTQLQCNTPPQTNDDSSFDVINGQLAYSGSNSWYKCDAGTGGYNLYTTQYYAHCTSVTLTVLEGCYDDVTTQCTGNTTASASDNGASTSSTTVEVTDSASTSASESVSISSSVSASTSATATQAAFAETDTSTSTVTSTVARDATSSASTLTFAVFGIVVAALTL